MVWDTLKKGLDAFMHPVKGTAKKMKLGDALGMYYRFSVIPLIIFIVLGFLVTALVASGLSSFGNTGLAGIATTALVVGAIVLFWIVLPIGMLIESIILHLVGKVMNDFKGDFENTFTAVVFSIFGTVAVLWMVFIPVIGGAIVAAFGLASVYVAVVALGNQHKTSNTLAPWIIATIIVLLIAGLLFSWILAWVYTVIGHLIGTSATLPLGSGVLPSGAYPSAGAVPV